MQLLLFPTHCQTNWSLDLEPCPAVVSFDSTYFDSTPSFRANIFFSFSSSGNFESINSNRCQGKKDATVDTSPERILRDGHRTGTDSSDAIPVEDPPFPPQPIETALEEVSIPFQRADDDN